MKPSRIAFATRQAALVLLLAAAPPLAAQTDVISYQGRLEQNGVTMNGAVNLRLSIHDALTGGSELYFTFGPQNVANGEFTALLGPFGANVFNGGNRWIEIAVDDPAITGLNYVPLTPRQPISATPYALRATAATTLTGNIAGSQVTGAIAGSQITGTLNPGLLSAGSVSNVLTFAGGGAPFSISNAASPTVTNLNADKLDGYDATAFLRTVGGTLTGNLGLQSPAVINFGTTTRQMLNLYNAEYAIGVQGDTLYQRSQSDWSWHRGGIHSDTRNAAGTDGTEVLRLTGNDLWLAPKIGSGESSSPPRLVFGNLNDFNNQPYVSVGEAPNLRDTLQLTADKVLVTSNTEGFSPVISFGETTGQHLRLFESSYDTYGLGVQGDTLYFRTGEQFAWFKDGIHSNTANAPGAGGTALMTLSRTGVLAPNGGIQIPYGQSVKVGLASINNAATSSMMQLNADAFIFKTISGDQIGSISSAGNLDLDGTISTTVLTIRGGADVAEPFEMTRPEDMEPGSVVVIDEDQPGQLKLSTESFDNKVAGIISGAGGVKPGLRLHQEGVMEGDHHVALGGRVYVKADAAFGKIKPGDLLTTSSTPGHAMKVKEHDQAQGAILGKAMSRLDEGTGLVLVLVTLQ